MQTTFLFSLYIAVFVLTGCSALERFDTKTTTESIRDGWLKREQECLLTVKQTRRDFANRKDNPRHYYMPDGSPVERQYSKDLASALKDLAQAEAALGKLDKAKQLYGEALKIAETTHDPNLVADIFNGRVYFHIEYSKDLKAACQDLERRCEILRLDPHRNGALVWDLSMLADFKVNFGELNEAEKLLKEAQAIINVDSSVAPTSKHYFFTSYSALERKKGNFALADKYKSEAQKEGDKIPF